VREWNIPRVPDLCRKHGVADSGFHMNFLRIQIFREFVDVETAKVTGRKQFGEMKQPTTEQWKPVKSNSSDAGRPSLGCQERVARRGKMGIPYGNTYQRLE
jgi:hypothetical protein